MIAKTLLGGVAAPGQRRCLNEVHRSAAAWATPKRKGEQSKVSRRHLEQDESNADCYRRTTSLRLAGRYVRHKQVPDDLYSTERYNRCNQS